MRAVRPLLPHRRRQAAARVLVQQRRRAVRLAHVGAHIRRHPERQVDRLAGVTVDDIHPEQRPSAHGAPHRRAERPRPQRLAWQHEAGVVGGQACRQLVVLHQPRRVHHRPLARQQAVQAHQADGGAGHMGRHGAGGEAGAVVVGGQGVNQGALASILGAHHPHLRPAPARRQLLQADRQGRHPILHGAPNQLHRREGGSQAALLGARPHPLVQPRGAAAAGQQVRFGAGQYDVQAVPDGGQRLGSHGGEGAVKVGKVNHKNDHRAGACRCFAEFGPHHRVKIKPGEQRVSSDALDPAERGRKRGSMPVSSSLAGGDDRRTRSAAARSTERTPPAWPHTPPAAPEGRLAARVTCKVSPPTRSDSSGRAATHQLGILLSHHGEGQRRRR